MPKACLPPGEGDLKHIDYPFWPLTEIPRSVTSRCGKGHGVFDIERFSLPPRYLRGNLEWPERILWGRGGNPQLPEGWGLFPANDGWALAYPKPVPPCGKWFFASPFYFAATFKLFGRIWHVRFGCRYTETEGHKWNYYTIPSLSVKVLRETRFEGVGGLVVKKVTTLFRRRNEDGSN